MMEALPKVLDGGNREDCLQHTSLAANSSYKNFVNDPNDICQWVANSATGSDQCHDIAGYDTSGPVHGNVSSTMDGSLFPSNISSRSMFSFVSQPASSVPGSHGLPMDYNTCTTSAGMCSSSMATSPGFLNGSYAGDDMNFLGGGFPDEAWAANCNQAYPAHVLEELLCGSKKTQQNAIPLGRLYENPGIHSSWPVVTSSVRTEGPPLAMDPLDHFSWPSLPMVAETSVSSSYSHGSDIVQHPSPPESSSTLEDVWPVEYTHMDNVGPCVTEYSQCESMHVSHPVNQIDDMDKNSTIRASRRSQRAPVLYPGPWSDCEPNPSWIPSLNSGSAYLQQYERETSTARTHPFYQAAPREDGLYHCPFIGTEGCSHQAEKLKCNYDKHLDSHLKPYECKVPGCGSVPFSSTACLLRHEREAHGMHGHGEKPHLCHYEDCDRSLPGNGFPRRWNLFDHMKRVHGFIGTPSSNGSISPTPSGTSHKGFSSMAFRKRRPSGVSEAEVPKRPKSIAGNKAPSKVPKDSSSSSATRQRKSMQLWQEQKTAIKARLDCLNPDDALGAEQIRADYAILHTIGMNIRSQEAVLFANF